MTPLSRITTPDQIGLHTISWKLYLFCIAISFMVLIEPAPTDLVFGIALFALALGGVQSVRVLGPVESAAIMLFMWCIVLSMIFIQGLHGQAIRAAGVQAYMILLMLMTAYFARIWGDFAFRKIMLMLIIGGLIASVIGILAYQGLMPLREIFFRDSHMLRIRATFKDPNVFAPFLVPSIIAALWITITTPRLRMIAGAATVIMTYGLIISYSRGGWAHLLISLAVFAIALLLYRKTAAPTLLTLIGLAGLGFVAGTYYSNEIALALEDSFFGRRLSVQSYDEGRFNRNIGVFYEMVNHPFGIGPYQARLMHTGEGPAEPHNSFALFGIHYGIPALIGYVMLIGAALYRCMAKIIAQRDGWFKYAFILSVMIGLLVLSNVVSSLHWRHFYVILGLAFGEYRSNAFFETGTRKAA